MEPELWHGGDIMMETEDSPEQALDIVGISNTGGGIRSCRRYRSSFIGFVNSKIHNRSEEEYALMALSILGQIMIDNGHIE